MNRKYLAFLAFSLLFLLPMGASAAVAASPGSATTVLGIPVQQRITGLTASTTYYLDCETSASTEADQTLTSDSAGVIVLTCYPSVTGENLYNLTLTNADGAQQTTWTVTNLDIMPYILVMVTVAIIFSIVRMFSGKRGLF
jgi:hypothetical protein